MTQVRPVVPRVLPPDEPATVNSKGMVGGLIAEMYRGPDFTSFQEARLVPRIRINYEGPAGEAPFSIKWSGFINIPAGGMSVTFFMNVRAAMIVEVDGQSVDSGPTGHGVKLAEGSHSITVKLSHIINPTGHRQVIMLRWVPAGEEMQTVPSAVFSHYKKDEPIGILASSVGSSTNVPSSVSGPPQGDRPVPAPAPVAPPPAPRKADVPPPTDAQLADLRKTIKTKYATYYAQPGLIVRQALVKKLLEAVDISTSTAERYALLRETSDLAAGIGDLKTALSCDDAITGIYKVDESELKLATLATAQHGPKNSTLSHELGVAAMEVSDHALEAGDYDVAVKAARLAENALGTSKDDDAMRAKARIREVRDIQAQFARIAPLMKKLKENPNDADTYLKVGRYFCFTAGNWEKGFPMLAKGSDIALKDLSELELNAPTNDDAQLKLGDAWWDKATSENLLSAIKCKERASYWYEKVRYGRAEEVPDQVLQRLATLSRTIDLAARVKLDQPAADPNDGPVARKLLLQQQQSGWKREHGALVSGGNGFNSVLDLPYRPVGDYDFIVEFTVTRGNGGISQGMPVRGLTMSWTINPNFANFEPVALRPGSFGPILRGDIPIVTGRRFQSVVQFRRGGVRGIINGTLIRDWATDYTELQSGYRAARTDPKNLSLRCTAPEVVIHAIRVVEVPHGQK